MAYTRITGVPTSCRTYVRGAPAWKHFRLHRDRRSRIAIGSQPDRSATSLRRAPGWAESPVVTYRYRKARHSTCRSRWGGAANEAIACTSCAPVYAENLVRLIW